MIEAVADVLGDDRAARDAAELLLEPDMELVDEFLGAGLSCSSPGICALPADLVLDLIEPADAQQSLGRDRRVAALGDV